MLKERMSESKKREQKEGKLEEKYPKTREREIRENEEVSRDIFLEKKIEN